MKGSPPEVRVHPIFALLVMPQVAIAQGSDSDLAQRAQDPTQPLTAFAVKYNIVSDFHNLPGASQQQITLQPIIPWKRGETTHIAGLTLGGVVSGPDWGQLAEAPPGVLPPDFTPTAEKTRIGDLAAVDLMVSGTSWGCQGFGLGAIIPTVSDPALGTEKWSVGPTCVAMT